MNKQKINLLTNAVLLVVGVFMIFFHGANVLVWGARVLGLLFFLPSLIYLIVVVARKAGERSNTDYLGMFPALGGVCFGLLMIIRPEIFVGVLQLLMGLLLIALGLYHVVCLAMSKDKLNLEDWLYIVPALVTLGGILCLTLLHDKEDALVIVTGICLLLFNFTSFKIYLAERRVREFEKLNDVKPNVKQVAAQKQADCDYDDDYLPPEATED